jgi:molecular chaperone DnaK
LTPDEIDRLIREADDFAESDRNTKAVLVLRTKLDSLLRNTKKAFTKFGGLLPEIEQETADRVFKEADEASKSEKIEDLNIVISKLERIAGQLTSLMLNPEVDAVKSE